MSGHDDGMPWLYDFVVWVFTVIFDLFFRQITPRGSYRIPKKGAVIFVAAPHANQFVDPMLLMQQVRYSSGRRISFLVAETSLKRPFIGFLSRTVSGIGVARVQDLLVKTSGTVYQNEQSSETQLLGKDTKFLKECPQGGHVSISGVGLCDIAEIVSDEEIILRKPLRSSAMAALKESPRTFKSAPRVDHSQMYHSVFSHLHHGHCIGIFPEGGSHDRTDLLPLKAGVAIMALGALAEDADCNVKIVPCGMNYFHPHKFRSRAVIEFGDPLSIPPELVEQYKKGGEEKRAAVKEVLDLITVKLKSVTITCDDYDTLMAIQAARRLYRPSSNKVPLSVVVDMTRRFLQGYNRYKDDPRIIRLKSNVSEYNKSLFDLGLRDHQVESASMGKARVFIRLMYRSAKLAVLLVASLPGTILFAPVFVATKAISKTKAQQALKASTVKIRARDVIATWKVLVAIGVAPLLYTFYAIIATVYCYRHGIIEPKFSSALTMMIVSNLIFPFLSYASLIIGETGMDIFKSLRPLALALNPSRANTIVQLKETRRQLITEITDLVNTLGPELYPELKQGKHVEDIVREEQREELEEIRAAARREARLTRNRSESDISDPGSLSRVGSERDLANIPIFSMNNGSMVSSESASPASAGAMSPKTSISSMDEVIESEASGQQQFQTEVSNRIRAAMSERQAAHRNN